MAGGTWERCVREVTLSADPETVGSVGAGWSNLSSGLQQLRDALVGRSFVGPVATGQERPNVGGLPGMLAGWKGSGGDAYREHLGKIGKQIEDLITDATNVSGALTRIEGDIRKSVATIPIPLMDDFGWNEWSLPNGTELDDARDGESASGFLAALRQDYQNNPASYADGAFRDKADDLEATMKVDGQAGDQKRGGWWDTKSHLDNWYRDNQQAANSAMAPLPKAVYTERPKLTVIGPETGGIDEVRRDTRIPPTGRPDISGEIGGKPDIGGGDRSIGSRPPGIGDVGNPTSSVDQFSPTKPGGLGDGSPTGGTGQLTTPPTGSGYPGSDQDYTSGLAGAAPSTVGGLGGGLGGGGIGSGGLGGVGGGLGGGAGVGAAGGIGAGGGLGAGAGIGVGGIPGMVGGGNGKVPPMTSAANALRTAAGAGGAGMAGGARGAGVGGAGMMGGGMMGGAGGAGHGGGSGTEHSSWLTEDDDPWGPGDGASPGVLR
ncbi:hypothetical protein EV382_3815 [Micromonospora violae]|uniref:Uncharacterized protein n=1 Tax=Micromonospora violae TaxID=1278207 RepID=A0A4Q7UI40_9ACTN|nr:hypothetical protein [Micromonospora violae]RZT80564.1 hypothetical protein EV382_3815 [Micromonospora violae]